VWEYGIPYIVPQFAVELYRGYFSGHRASQSLIPVRMLFDGFSIIIFYFFVISILKPNIQMIIRNANAARHTYPKPKKTYGMILINIMLVSLQLDDKDK
jgi:hypothetical protein